MLNPDEKVLRSLISLNKQNDINWQNVLGWLKESYLREGMNTNEIDDAAQTEISKGQVRQLRQMLNTINNAEDMLERQMEAIRKAAAQ
jgi:hypothetical protein